MALGQERLSISCGPGRVNLRFSGEVATARGSFSRNESVPETYCAEERLDADTGEMVCVRRERQRSYRVTYQGLLDIVKLQDSAPGVGPGDQD